MNWFLAGWVLVLQAVFWGYGLTLFLLPARWRRFWLGFVAPVGLALQSAVVWTGAHTNLPGTDSYGIAAQLLPLGLAGAAIWRQGGAESWRTFAAARRWWVLLPILCVSLGLQIAPFTKPPALLTVHSLGSCDAADYAAGARVFKEFAARDRSGYIGQTEETRLLGVDNFFDFWLRLNHFTPSALLALDSTLLRRQPYELTSLIGVVFLLLNLPTVYWLSRALFRFRSWAAALVTAIYSVCPILLYAVYQTALAQLLAAPTVALILWTCWQADRAVRQRSTGRRMWVYAGLLLAMNSLLLGSYNFFLLFAYVPLVAYLGGRALLGRPRSWRALGRMAGFVGASLAVCTLFFPARIISLGERFFLFNRTPFGWPIPTFRPDGWFGIFGGVKLQPAVSGMWAFGVIGLAATVAIGCWLARRGGGRTAGLAAACTLPILFGYGILSWEEAAHVRINASYDAYKLFTVFYPVMLPAFCLFLRAGGLRVTSWSLGIGLGAVVLLGLNVQGALRYNAVLRQQTAMVDRPLAELATLEACPEVDGINIRVQTLWDRLWANQFLLHKKQYFELPTYEGRNVAPLRGRWDLRDRSFSTDLPPGDDLLDGNGSFALLDRQAPTFLDFRLAGNWYEPEQGRDERWAWSNGGPASVVINNPHPEVRAARLRLRGDGLHARPLRLFVGDKLAWEGTVPAVLGTFADPVIQLQPGQNLLRFETPGPPDQVPGDPRPFGFALYGLGLQPLATVPAGDATSR